MTFYYRENRATHVHISTTLLLVTIIPLVFPVDVFVTKYKVKTLNKIQVKILLSEPRLIAAPYYPRCFEVYDTKIHITTSRSVHYCEF